ncbi:hypothetical protein H8M03_07740 [Sphingomonas sabuli]|uniref:Uncharacterized protein n=2 Tax=Sphingomonas sabuli TaxID=2764186 RepID=A0A7G9L600_9SPHN|nr:hypothetical protein H8M03_07740 [Sphingomonas sabuli]
MGDERFFLKSSIIMATIVVIAFSMQVLLGRSTFASPARVHAHAVLFMGWIVIYLVQNLLVRANRVDLHRKLGWIAAAWMAAMVVSGFIVTTAIVRAGTVPFFIQPLHFLVSDYLAIPTFAGLTAAAIAMRRRTEWHRRLHFCGMTILMGPAFGRLLPMPYLEPWAWESAFAVTLLFPLAGVLADRKHRGHVHAAWKWGIAAILGSFALTEAVTYAPVGTVIYEAVTAGYPGASLPPLEFQAPPDGPLTGRS